MLTEIDGKLFGRGSTDDKVKVSKYYKLLIYGRVKQHETSSCLDQHSLVSCMAGVGRALSVINGDTEN